MPCGCGVPLDAFLFLVEEEEVEVDDILDVTRQFLTPVSKEQILG